jgi:hypothetical protein
MNILVIKALAYQPHGRHRCFRRKILWFILPSGRVSQNCVMWVRLSALPDRMKSQSRSVWNTLKSTSKCSLTKQKVCLVVLINPTRHLIQRPSMWSSGQSSWLQNGDALCFLWGRNCIYICYVEGKRLCGLVVWVNGYRTEKYCDSCEVRTEFIYVM